MGGRVEQEPGRLVIKARGTVQGVGFRPCVYGIATAMGLTGFVANTADGVDMEVEGPGVAQFPGRLRQGLPPLASLTSLTVESVPLMGYRDFRIIRSAGSGGFTLISPDVSTCPDCFNELTDPLDRRYGYPFINCTNCGPRYTITRQTPYDRPNTTMDAFVMCPDCRAEYDDPADRRFHAVPNACRACGPRIWFVRDGEEVDTKDPLEKGASVISAGGILAIKGLGGFHLAVDAFNEQAVMELRKRKKRPDKAFALMALDIKTIKEHCLTSPDEEALLASSRRPVVLLKKKAGSGLAGALAPGLGELGFMLPYTPLHYMLMLRQSQVSIGVAVMTSGNMSEEPIQYDNHEAQGVLSPLADAFVLHDRDIFMRVDDSVMRSGVDGFPALFIRRARGYAPEAVPLSTGGPDVLAVGADMKNTFALFKGDRAVLSQHMGDMDKYETVGLFEQTLENLKAVYRAEPVALAHDMHRGYGSTSWALSQDLPKLEIQHHHAHIASVMVEHRLEGEVIGVALDGTGYGPDGRLWGGEFLLAGLGGFARLGHLGYVRLPGGQQAIREPWRIAAALMEDAFGQVEGASMMEQSGLASCMGQVADVLKVAALEQFSPLSSGAGRMFDAASALLGLCLKASYEGEPAMKLEAAAAMAPGCGESYGFDVTSGSCPAINMTGVFREMALDMAQGRAVPEIAMAFHNTMSRAVLEAVSGIARVTGKKQVALSGGVFQSRIMLGLVSSMLKGAGFDVYDNRLVPANDGGISLGQGAILRARLDAAV